MLFLIDLPVNEGLKKYSQENDVKVVQIGSDKVKRILEYRGNTVELRNEAQRLNLFPEESLS